jgi:hypothetical protein
MPALLSVLRVSNHADGYEPCTVFRIWEHSCCTASYVDLYVRPFGVLAMKIFIEADSG